MASEGKGAYREPPVETRYKPGESGNPRGRPKGRTEIVAEAYAILTEPVRARTSEGTVEILEAVEASFLALCRRGLKGDVPALIEAIRMGITVLPAGQLKTQTDKAKQRAAMLLLAAKLGHTVPPHLLRDD